MIIIKHYLYGRFLRNMYIKYNQCITYVHIPEYKLTLINNSL